MKIISKLNNTPHQLTVDAFDKSGDKLPELTEENYDHLPTGSTVNAVFSLSRITTGSYGIVLKLVVRQILIKKETILSTDASLLADSDEVDDGYKSNEGAWFF